MGVCVCVCWGGEGGGGSSLQDIILSWVSRHGNCPRKCTFLWQGNRLSVEEKKWFVGKINWQYKNNKKGSIGFSCTLNIRETYGAHSYVALARLGHVIVSTVTCSYSRGLATGLNAVILIHFCTVSAKKKRMLRQF